MIRCILLLAILTCSVPTKATDALIHSFNSYKQAGNFNACLRVLDTLQMKYPQEMEYTVWRAQVQAWQGNTTLALTLMKTVFQQNANAYRYYLTATFWGWQQQWDSALVYIEKSILLDSSSLESKQKKADILFHLKKYRACVEQLRQDNLLTHPAMQQVYKACYANMFRHRISLGSSLRSGTGIPQITYFASVQNKYNQFTSITTLSFPKNLGTPAVQEELYHSSGRAGYQYLAFRFSASPSNPSYSWSAVYFYPYRKFESDLGIRYYASSKGHSLWVPSIGLTLHKPGLSCSYRFYQVVGNTIHGQTHALSIKKVSKTNDTYVKLDFITGKEQDILNQANFDMDKETQTSSVIFSTQIPVHRRILVQTSGAYQYALFNQLQGQRNFLFSIQTSYKF